MLNCQLDAEVLCPPVSSSRLPLPSPLPPVSRAPDLPTLSSPNPESKFASGCMQSAASNTSWCTLHELESAAGRAVGCQPPNNQPSPDRPLSTPMHRAVTGSNKRKASSAKGGPARRRKGGDSDDSDFDGSSSASASDSSGSSDDEYHAPTSDSEGEEVDDDDSDEEEDWMATTTAAKATKKRAKAAPPKQTSAGGGATHRSR